MWPAHLLKRTSDGEPERAAFFNKRITLAERRNRLKESLVVREHGTVRYDRRLQELPDHLGIVRPINAEGGLNHG
jgi:hypothetical protein